MADPTVVAWIGVFVGAVIATMWPYYNATKAKPGTKFNYHYLASLVVGVLLGMPSALVAYALVVGAIPAAFVTYADSSWFIFAFGLMVGAGIDRWLNERIVDKARA